MSEDTFHRVQAILKGRVQVVGPHKRGRPDFPLKGLVRCDACGRPLTASWSRGRNARYAYYHCWRQCHAVNVSKEKLEGQFVGERLQPTPGYMRLVRELVLRVWQERKAQVGRDAVDAEQRAAAMVADDEGDDLTDDERRALHEALATSWQSAEAGRLRPASEILDELRQQQ